VRGGSLLPLARPATIPRARVVETGRKAFPTNPKNKQDVGKRLSYSALSMARTSPPSAIPCPQARPSTALRSSSPSITRMAASNRSPAARALASRLPEPISNGSPLKPRSSARPSWSAAPKSRSPWPFVTRGMTGPTTASPMAQACLSRLSAPMTGRCRRSEKTFASWSDSRRRGRK
jgi:hypothetical protein